MFFCLHTHTTCPKIDKNDTIPRKDRNKSKDPPRSLAHPRPSTPRYPERALRRITPRAPPPAAAVRRTKNFSSKKDLDFESDGDDCRGRDMERSQEDVTFHNKAYKTVEKEKEDGEVHTPDNKDAGLYSKEEFIKFNLNNKDWSRSETLHSHNGKGIDAKAYRPRPK